MLIWQGSNAIPYHEIPWHISQRNNNLQLRFTGEEN